MHKKTLPLLWNNNINVDLGPKAYLSKKKKIR